MQTTFHVPSGHHAGQSGIRQAHTGNGLWGHSAGYPMVSTPSCPHHRPSASNHTRVPWRCHDVLRTNKLTAGKRVWECACGYSVFSFFSVGAVWVIGFELWNNLMIVCY